MTKALAMMSGGLDSVLAAKIIKDQGIDVIGICFRSYFFSEKNAVRMAKQVDVPLIVVDFSKDHLEMVKNPKYGYGKNINPCIDCHAMMMKYSGNLLTKYNADFIITGEVLNQRPMSQNKGSLDIVKKESGFSDKILRPLCAKNIEPTEMELNGLVDREKLLDISGRQRIIQMELAEKFGIHDYPSPAGGCSLTEPNYAIRLKELLKFNNNPSENSLMLLSLGRHFRTELGAKIISTRDEKEENAIGKYLTEEDIVLRAKDFNGSLIVIQGKTQALDIEFAAKIAARYSKGKNEKCVAVEFGDFNSSLNKLIEVKPASDEELTTYNINAWGRIWD